MGRLIIVNREAEAIFGHALGESMADVSAGGRAFHADGRPLAEGEWPMERAIRGGQVIIGEMIEIERRRRASPHLVLNSAPVRTRRVRSMRVSRFSGT